MPPKLKKGQSKQKSKPQIQSQSKRSSSKLDISKESEPSKEEILFADKFGSRFLRLLGLIDNCPKEYQEAFIPYLTHISQKAFSHTTSIIAVSDRLLSKVTYKKKFKITQHWKEIFADLVKLFDLTTFFDTLIQQQIIFSLPDFFKKSYQEPDNSNYSPLSQLKFPKLRHPEYFLIQLMAKYEGQHAIGKRFKQKDTMKSRFFKEPRFIEKLETLVHLRDNGKHKGSIVLLQYSGNFIVGDRVFAIAKENYFEIWQKTQFDYPFPFEKELPKNLKHIPPQFHVPSDDEQTSEQQKTQESIKPVFGLQRSFKFIGHTSKVTCASFSSDQYFIVTGNADRNIKLWCLRMNVLLATFKGHTKTVWDVHFNPSGLYFLSGGADGLVILWKTDNPKPQRIFSHSRDIFKVQFAKNPQYALAAGDEGILYIYNLIHATIEKRINLGVSIINFNLGHTGIYIALITTQGKVIVHNVQQGTTLGSFSFHFQTSKDTKSKKQTIHEVCFTEDEKDLVCLTNKQILYYSLHSLSLAIDTTLEQSQQEELIPEKMIAPYMVLMSFDELRFTYCKFTHKNLLLVAGTKYTP